MLVYTAELKLPMRIPFKDKVRKVQSVVDQLALNTCRNVRIGNPLTRGISGGWGPLDTLRGAHSMQQHMALPVCHRNHLIKRGEGRGSARAVGDGRHAVLPCARLQLSMMT